MINAARRLGAGLVAVVGIQRTSHDANVSVDPDGAGVFRLSREQTRFERLKLSLPSQRLTALLEKDGFLYIGTDEGLTRWPVERDVQP